MFCTRNSAQTGNWQHFCKPIRIPSPRKTRLNDKYARVWRTRVVVEGAATRRAHKRENIAISAQVRT